MSTAPILLTHFKNHWLDKRHLWFSLNRFLTEWPHRMDSDTIQQAVWLFNNTNCPWSRLQTGTVLFHGMFFVQRFSSRIFSLSWQTVTPLFFLNFWWALVVCIRLLGSAYGQRQVASHANEKGPGNWSLCYSDTFHACVSHSAVVLCVDHMSKVGHVTTLLQFWFPKTQHCWNGLVTLVSYGISLAALFILLTWLLLRERYNVTVNIASSFFTACFSKSSVWPSGLSQYEDVTLVSQKYRKFRVSVESLQE